MATIRAYTTIEQSKKLAKILPLESADMKILPFNKIEYRIVPVNDIAVCGREDEIYAWSLAALLDVLPVLERRGYQKAKPRLLYNVNINKWIVDSHVYTTDAYDNPVDACVEMILKLHELNIL